MKLSLYQRVEIYGTALRFEITCTVGRYGGKKQEGKYWNKTICPEDLKSTVTSIACIAFKCLTVNMYGIVI